MLCLIFPIFILSASVKIPKYTIVMLSESYTPELIKQFEDAMKDYKKNMKALCKDITDNKSDREACEAGMDAFEGYILGDGSDIDSVLSKVSKKTDFLYYMSMLFDSEKQVVNFNSLKSKMSVFYVDFTSLFPISAKLNKDNTLEFLTKINQKIVKKMIKSRFDGSQESVLRHGKLLAKKKGKSPKSNDLTLLRGDIGSKVSYLTVAYQNIKFVGGACNCHTLFLCESKIDSESEKIISDNLVVDEYSHNKLSSSDKVEVNQYTLYLITIKVDFDGEPTQQYQVIYNSKRWELKEAKRGQLFGNFPKYGVPYTFSKRFSIIVFTFYIDIQVSDTTLDYYSEVNVTVLDRPLDTSAPGLGMGANELESKSLTITTSGEWEKVANKPKLILTCDESKFEVKKSENIQLEVETQPLYSFKPKKSGPNIGMIVGIVVAVVVVIAIVVVVVIIVIRKKNRANDKSSNEGNGNQDENKADEA